MTGAIQLRRQMCQPIERSKLSRCLSILGVREPKRRDEFRAYKKVRPSIGKMTVWQLTDLYEAAKRAWLKLYRKYRPDLNRNHDIGVWLNLLWTHTKKLFKRKGIETI